jgi:hypothetical protein
MMTTTATEGKQLRWPRPPLSSWGRKGWQQQQGRGRWWWQQWRRQRRQWQWQRQWHDNNNGDNSDDNNNYNNGVSSPAMIKSTGTAVLVPHLAHSGFDVAIITCHRAVLHRPQMRWGTSLDLSHSMLDDCCMPRLGAGSEAPWWPRDYSSRHRHGASMCGLLCFT